VWKFVVLLAIVAVGSYYAARFLLEGWPRHPHRDDDFQRPMGPDDDDEFLAQISKRYKRPEDPS
jgi:hypothetical protein